MAIAVIQRVSTATVRVGGEERSRIGHGALVLVAIQRDDTTLTVSKLVEQVIRRHLFESRPGKIDQNILQAAGEVLWVPQFTLAARFRGPRPSFVEAAAPARALELFSHAVELSERAGAKSKRAPFQEEMEITLVNEGPVTYLFTTHKKGNSEELP